MHGTAGQRKVRNTFVADNTRSLVEAAYEDGLYTLGVYDGVTMVRVVLYDYDDTYPGWSMSRFIDRPSVSGLRVRQAGRPGVS